MAPLPQRCCTPSRTSTSLAPIAPTLTPVFCTNPTLLHDKGAVALCWGRWPAFAPNGSRRNHFPRRSLRATSHRHENCSRMPYSSGPRPCHRGRSIAQIPCGSNFPQDLALRRERGGALRCVHWLYRGQRAGRAGLVERIHGGGAQGGTAGSGGATSPSNASASGAASGAPDPNAAGVMPLMRLTNREYDDTVHDLLGDTTQPATQFASDRDPTFEFRRAGDLAVQDATLLETAAESLAAAAIPNLDTMLSCAPTGGDACAQQFITQFGARAFRRPLSSAEASRLMALYTTGTTTLNLAFPEAISLLIEAMLQSPQFLYHWEISPNDAPIYDGCAAAGRVSHRIAALVLHLGINRPTTRCSRRRPAASSIRLPV